MKLLLSIFKNIMENFAILAEMLKGLNLIRKVRITFTRHWQGSDDKRKSTMLSWLNVSAHFSQLVK